MSGPDFDSRDLLAWLDSIDFDVAWDRALADLRAEGVDTDKLLRDATDNLRRWQAEAVAMREAAK